MDYSKYLVLYSGGADSTHFVESESSAKYLLHYSGLNDAQTRIAAVNAQLLGRYITIVQRPLGTSPVRDGESNEIHALYDTEMALDASLRAIHHGMAGIVLCFNADDIGIDADSLQTIIRRAEPAFEILQPLRNLNDSQIKAARVASQLKTVSCMFSDNCGHCPKCLRRGIKWVPTNP